MIAFMRVNASLAQLTDTFMYMKTQLFQFFVSPRPPHSLLHFFQEVSVRTTQSRLFVYITPNPFSKPTTHLQPTFQWNHHTMHLEALTAA